MKLVIFDLDDTLFDTTGQLDETYVNLPNIKLFPEAREVLSHTGFSKVLVSRGREEIQNKKVDILRIREYFDEVLICGADPEKKDLFEKIVEKYKNQSNKDVFVVGNRRDSEIRYGKMLGMKTVLVLHGKYKDLKPQDDFDIPDYVIHNLKELLDILA